MKIRRVGAYGICRDESGRVLLARNSPLSEFPGLWTLPGGGVEQGEHPDDAVVREFGEETGLEVRVDGLNTVTADVFRLPGGDLEHTDRIIYDVSVLGGTLQNEAEGTTELVEWVTDPSALPLMPFTAAALGHHFSDISEKSGNGGVETAAEGGVAGQAGPVGGGGGGRGGAAEGVVGQSGAVEGVAGQSGAVEGGGAGTAEGNAGLVDLAGVAAADEEVARPDRVQRFGAYAAASDPGGRVLLTKIAAGYPGAGRWHVPGGGTDHGETPEAALAREVFEETGQHGRVTGLVEISHRYDPRAVGPEGVPIDWHVIRVLFRVEVDTPTEPAVKEVDGSTAEARWFTLDEARRLDLTEPAAVAVARIGAERAS